MQLGPQAPPPTVIVGASPPTIVQQQMPWPSSPQEPTNATIALVLSIVGLILLLFYGTGLCFAIPGLILANGALKITNKYPNHPDSGTAKAAKIISLIVLVLFLFTVVLVILAISLFFFL